MSHTLKKKWLLPERISDQQIQALVYNLNILSPTAQLLIKRGLEDTVTAKLFINPKGLRFRDFKDLPGTVLAGEKIASAIKAKQLILIYGDYDVDGITSSALLAEFIRTRGGKCEIYLPNRYADGYGLTESFVERAIALGAEWLITVDCGIKSLDEISVAKKNNLSVIVIDHHTPADKLPEAEVIVNPKVSGPKELEILAGVGVTLQVVRAIAKALDEKDPEALRKFLDLVALGTVADVVPLLGENRSLIRAGLAVIKRNERKGLQALINKTGIEINKINATSIAFILAPRLNSAGRMGSAQPSLELLLSNDSMLVEELATFLDQTNNQRQLLEKKILKEAEEQLAKLTEIPRVIVVSDSAWSQGVIGLVAARLCEKYHRPAFVLVDNEGILKGSARSIPGFILPQVLEKMEKLLKKWGGHAMAAGVTITVDNLSAFKEALQVAALDLDEDELMPEIKLELELTLEEISLRLIREFNMLEPYGCGNPKPLILVKKVICSESRLVGSNHLKFRVKDEKNNYLEVIGFNLGDRKSDLKDGLVIDMAGYIGENNWNNKTTLQFDLKDFRISLN